MRRSLKIAAGAAVATLLGITGAQALQVVPGVAGNRDSWPTAFGPDNLVTGTSWSADWTTKNHYALPGAPGDGQTSGPRFIGAPPVGNLHWPNRPYLDKDVVGPGDNVITIHGTCGLYNPATRRGELTPYPIDILQSGIKVGNGGLITNPGPKGWVPLNRTSFMLLGEYPGGSTDATPDPVTVDPAWAFGNPTTSDGLEYAHPSAIGRNQADNYLDDYKTPPPGGDTNGIATAHPLFTNNHVSIYDGTSPIKVQYIGRVEYLVYSDSYAGGPIDLDVAPINGDGSYDIKFDTAGLAPDGYALRFLGCNDLSVKVSDGLQIYRVNYYQGVPNGDSDVFTNYDNNVGGTNVSRNLNNYSSYVPTGLPGTGMGFAQQAPLGADIYVCWYPAVSVGWDVFSNYIDPAFIKIAGNSAGLFVAIAPWFWNLVDNPTNLGSTPLALPAGASIVVAAAQGVAGRGPNEQGWTGGGFGAGSFLGGKLDLRSFILADNAVCDPYLLLLPNGVLPLTSGYNGNTDLFNCSNLYNNHQGYFSPGNQGGTGDTQGFSIHPGVGIGTGHGAGPGVGQGTTTQGGLPSCPSGYDGVGIRANSIYDLYARFHKTGGAAAPAGASAPAFVAPTNAAAAAAVAQSVQQATTAAAGQTTQLPASTPAANATVNSNVAPTASSDAPVSQPVAQASAQTSIGSVNLEVLKTVTAQYVNAGSKTTTVKSVKITPVVKKTVVKKALAKKTVRK